MRIIDTPLGPCALRRSKRRTLAISVLPDGTVELVAPLKIGLPAIRDRVARRAGWIARQRRFFTGLQADRPPRRYCTGATHRYLGRQYRLKVIKTDQPGVRLIGACFHVFTRLNTPEVVADLLNDWMRRHAREQFARRLGKWRTWRVAQGLPEPRLYLRAMPKRWGSMHRDGRLFLNPELVRAPSLCIDYVIAHEICHLKHPRHDQAFHATLDRLCPGWESVKQRLERLSL